MDFEKLSRLTARDIEAMAQELRAEAGCDHGGEDLGLIEKFGISICMSDSDANTYEFASGSQTKVWVPKGGTMPIDRSYWIIAIALCAFMRKGLIQQLSGRCKLEDFPEALRSNARRLGAALVIPKEKLLELLPLIKGNDRLAAMRFGVPIEVLRLRKGELEKL